ncbi:MAG: ATP-binding cassette domain-containing protein [Pleurocapsa minor GSE-CHR-MK-17-07R]|nr:ATP-binding cassette domain-containing protein [Pleurocapsa minor GSE-CHR-MK 17-07R]
MQSLSIRQLSKFFGDAAILRDITLALHSGERIGLVGANGVGKTTLLRILASELTADGGTVTLADGLRLGYLPQHIAPQAGRTLGDLIDASAAWVRGLEADMRALESSFAALGGDGLAAALARYGDLQEAFERADGYALDSRIDAALTGLGVAHIAHAQPFDTLSGGEKTRASLALLLIQSPDVLLLDEPTNHLDAGMLDWLEGTLKAYRGAALMASHDRAFLNAVATGIFEIDEHTRSGRLYRDRYDGYAAAKQAERRKWEEDFIRQGEEIKALKFEIAVTARRNDRFREVTDNDKFVKNIKRDTHAATASKRIRSAEEKLARIEADPIPRPPVPLRFAAQFGAHALDSRIPLQLERVSKAYDGVTVLHELSLTVHNGARILVTGDNGAGKSTLLRLMAGLIQPDTGYVALNPGVIPGYLDQEAELLWLGGTVFEAFRRDLPQDDQALKSLIISMGLMRYESLDTPARGMSLGQRRKVQLARLIASGANLLILDEPTNYLSFDVVESFENALASFEGAVIAASHDRRFIERFGGQRIHLGSAHALPA